MWGNKKSHTPQTADPEPKNSQTNQPPKPVPPSWEGTTKTSKDAMGPAGATARLGSSLHVKGEISGNEDLYIDLRRRQFSVHRTVLLPINVSKGGNRRCGRANRQGPGTKPSPQASPSSTSAAVREDAASSKTEHTSRARSRSTGARIYYQDLTSHLPRCFAFRIRPEPRRSLPRSLFSGKPEVIRCALRGGFVRGAFPLAQLTVA